MPKPLSGQRSNKNTVELLLASLIKDELIKNGIRIAFFITCFPSVVTRNT